MDRNYKEEAKSLLLANVESELQKETVVLIKDYEAKLKDEAREKAREIIRDYAVKYF